MLLLILIVLTVGISVLIVHSILNNNSNLTSASFTALILVGLVGWGVMGTAIPLDTKNWDNVEVVVLQDKNIVHLSHNGKIFASYNDIPTYNYLLDKKTIQINIVKKYNMYKQLIEMEYQFLKIEDDL